MKPVILRPTFEPVSPLKGLDKTVPVPRSSKTVNKVPMGPPPVTPLSGVLALARTMPKTELVKVLGKPLKLTPPNNPLLFNGAVWGLCSAPGAVPLDPTQADYAGFAAAVAQVSSLIDSLIPAISGGATQSQASMLQGIVNSAFTGRQLVNFSNAQLASTVTAIAAQFQETNIQLQTGIPTPPPAGGVPNFVLRESFDSTHVITSWAAISLDQYGVTQSSSATENVTAINNAQNYLRSLNGGLLIFPSWNVAINELIDFGSADGLTQGIIWQGQARTLLGFGLTDPSTGKLMWSGGTGSPMVRMGSSRRCAIQNLTIDTRGVADWALQVLHDVTMPDPIPTCTITTDDNEFWGNTFTCGALGAVICGLHNQYCAGDTSRTSFIDNVFISYPMNELPPLTPIADALLYYNSSNGFSSISWNNRLECSLGSNTPQPGYMFNVSVNYGLCVVSGSFNNYGGTIVGAGLSDMIVRPNTGNEVPNCLFEPGESEFSGGPYLTVIKHADIQQTANSADGVVQLIGGRHDSSAQAVSVKVDFGTGATLYGNYNRVPIIIRGATLEGCVQVLTPGAKVILDGARFDGPDSTLPFGRTDRPAGPVINSIFVADTTLASGTFVWGTEYVNLDIQNNPLTPLQDADMIVVPGSGCRIQPWPFVAQTMSQGSSWYGVGACNNYRAVISLADATANLALSQDGGKTFSFSKLPVVGWTNICMIPGLWIIGNSTGFADPNGGVGNRQYGVSTDNGMTWTYYNFGGFGFIGNSIAIDPTTNNVMLGRSGNTAGVNLLFGNVVNGVWTQKTTGRTTGQKLAWMNGVWYQSQIGTPLVLKSSDNGNTWSDAGLVDVGMQAFALGAYRGLLYVLCTAPPYTVWHLSVLSQSGASAGSWATFTIPAAVGVNDLAAGVGSWIGVASGTTSIIQAPTGGQLLVP